MVTIKLANTDDATVITELYTRARRTFIPYAPMVHTRDAVEAWFRDSVIPEHGTYLANSETGEVVGFVVLSKEHDQEEFWWLDQLYVDVDVVGRGVGGDIMNWVLQTFGDRPIRLYCFQENEGARRFYTRFGFKPLAFSDGSSNEEKCPDVLFERCPLDE